jgi:tRNA pseudouridine38-40 synthase
MIAGAMTLFDDPDARDDVTDPSDPGDPADPRPVVPVVPQTRVRMLVAYDGAGFHGFAAQPGVTTVGGTLARTVARVLRVPDVELSCAGRTDTGVHAWGQVVTFDVPAAALARSGSTAAALDRLQQSVNKLCGPAVVVREAEVVEAPFDARFSATSRLYRYTIVNRPWPDPFLAPVAWHVAPALDRRSLDLACDPFVGEHDFSSFCRRPRTKGGPGPADTEVSLTRRVLSARWEDAGDGVLRFWIEATAFCHQMVRSIVGTLVEVGRGRIRAGDVLGIISAGDRHAAGDLAPPQGLCLWAVRYGGTAPAAPADGGGREPGPPTG